MDIERDIIKSMERGFREEVVKLITKLQRKEYENEIDFHEDVYNTLSEINALRDFLLKDFAIKVRIHLNNVYIDTMHMVYQKLKNVRNQHFPEGFKGTVERLST